jgi:hypothetical protein
MVALAAEAGGDAAFMLSPPALNGTPTSAGSLYSPAANYAAGVFAERRHEINTNLRDLKDIHGLALLMVDDRAVGTIGSVLKKWEANYQTLLTSDPVLMKINSRIRTLFSQSLSDRVRPSGEFAKIIAAAPKERLKPTLSLWLRSLFTRKDVAFEEDLWHLNKRDLDHVCGEAQSMDSLKGLSTWRYRVLAWIYRDREVKRLHQDRDERVAFLTSIRLDKQKLDPDTVRTVQRYLAMLENLRLQVLKDRQMPYDRFRTLEGLLRGLRYMDTIRYACAQTGLDHRIMTRLFIQESEFIHERVSHAGAFSLAQFLNIALKDIWLFQKRIPGAGVLLKGIASYEDLKKKVVADPRMAIKASCVYFRRLRDEVNMRLGSRARKTSQEILSIMTLEMLSLRQGVSEKATVDSVIEMTRSWPVKDLVLLPLLPFAGALVPDAGAFFSGWMERTVREVAHIQISEGVFKERMNLLHTALGLSAYNAGMSNLLKSAKRRIPFEALSFPLQIAETRNYVDDILDGTEILHDIKKIVSDVAQMDYDELLKLAKKACQIARKRQK